MTLSEPVPQPEPTTPPDPTAALEARVRALQPFLGQLLLGSERELPASLAVGTARLELDPWERETLQNSGHAGDHRRGTWPTLVAEGVAFRAKCLQHSQREDTEQASSLAEKSPQAIDQLITDTAIGIALMTELQRSINRLLFEGEARAAKLLTQFRNGIGREVAGMSVLIGDDGFAEARERSQELLRPPESPLRAEETAQEEPPVQFKRRRRRGRMISRRIVQKSRRPKFLAAGLAVCLVAWAGVMLTRPTHVAPTVLTIENFRDVRAVNAVSARPPSLFVELSPSMWARMTPAERLEAIEAIGRTAARAGYSGMFARTSEGVAAGQWLEKRGVSLIESAPEGT